MLKIYYSDASFIKDDEFIMDNLNKVTMQRRNKILRCRNFRDKRLSFLAGLLVKHAITKEGYDYWTVVFDQSSKGKLLLKECGNLKISITHSGNYAAVAVSDENVGIDMEQISRFDINNDEIKCKINKIINKCFTENEKLYCINDKESITKVWTGKESFSKLKGLGLGMDFKEINTLDEELFWSTRIDDYVLTVSCEELGNQKGIEFIEDVGGLLCTMN